MKYGDINLANSDNDTPIVLTNTLNSDVITLQNDGTGTALYINANGALAAGKHAAYFYHFVASTALDNAVVKIMNDSAGAANACLQIENDGSGACIACTLSPDTRQFNQAYPAITLGDQLSFQADTSNGGSGYICFNALYDTDNSWEAHKVGTNYGCAQIRIGAGSVAHGYFIFYSAAPTAEGADISFNEKFRIDQYTGDTGGSGSGGAGNQYVTLTINGLKYKILHDGTYA